MSIRFFKSVNVLLSLELTVNVLLALAGRYFKLPVYVIFAMYVPISKPEISAIIGSLPTFAVNMTLLSTVMLTILVASEGKVTVNVAFSP